MPNLSDCLHQATRYWDTKRSGSVVMTMRAKACVDILSGGPGKAKGGAKRKADTLGTKDAIHVLEGLRKRGLSPASQAHYYAAFRRMLALNGVSTMGWPSGATPPRRSREPIAQADLMRLIGELWKQGASETAYLARILESTGMRVDVEALDWDAWEVLEGRRLKITGKGGHERVIPVEDANVWDLLRNSEKVDPMRKLTYSAHLKRWKKATDKLGITSRLPTPHAIRHYYATQAYARCKDLRVVQELLGHADISTTARYIGADMEKLRAAVSQA